MIADVFNKPAPHISILTFFIFVLCRVVCSVLFGKLIMCAINNIFVGVCAACSVSLPAVRVPSLCVENSPPLFPICGSPPLVKKNSSKKK